MERWIPGSATKGVARRSSPASQARPVSSAAGAGVWRAGTRPPQPDRFLRFPDPDMSAHTGRGTNRGGSDGEEARHCLLLSGSRGGGASRFFGGSVGRGG